MKLVRLTDDDGSPRFAQDRGDGTARWLAPGPWPRPDSVGGEAFSLADPARKRLAPVDPPDFFCIGLNYRRHAAEMGSELPAHPVVFMKPGSALCHPGEAIRIPAGQMDGPETDVEAELAVVMGTLDGRPARDVSVDDALKYVLGYTCGNDVSARRWQKQGGGGQWTRGKGFDTFGPLGPTLVTADELTDPQALRIVGRLNGQTTQDSHTSDMIFSVAEIVSFLSRDTTLRPGSVILTGTPEGVGVARDPQVFLQAGDVVEIDIEKIGVLRNPVEQAR